MSTSNDLHDDSTVTPAADAGPRQPCAGGGGYGSCRDARDPELCANCEPDAHAAAPVPQEAAPREVFIYGVPPDEVAELDRQADEAHAPLEAARVKATAPDSAMRVAERTEPGEFVELLRAEMRRRFSNTLSMEQISEFSYAVAALIRQAGSERERELLRRILAELKERDFVCCQDDEHADGCPMAEASRLLGGESK